MSAHNYMVTMRRLYSLAQRLDLPVDFTESTTTQDHRPVFIVRATAGDVSAEAREPNRRNAKTQACVLVLEQLEMSAPFSGKNTCSKKKHHAKAKDHSHPDFRLDKDPNSRLAELLMTLKHPPAQYRLVEGTVKSGHWAFTIEVSLDQFVAVGQGPSKKEARRRATTALLQMMGYTVPEEELVPPAPPQTNTEPSPLQTNTEPAPPQTNTEPAPPQTNTEPAPPQTNTEPAPPQTNTKKEQAPENQTLNQTPSAPAKKCKRRPPAHIPPDFGLGKDPSSRLSELQMMRQEKFPKYHMVRGELVSGSWMFTMEVSLDQCTASGSGRSKKEAKKRAATALLLMLGFTVPEEDLLEEKPDKQQSSPPAEVHNMGEDHTPEEPQSPAEESTSQENLDHRPSEEEQKTIISAETIPEDLGILQNFKLMEVLVMNAQNPVNEPHLNNSSEGVQSLEAQSQYEKPEIPEDVECPMEMHILEVLESNSEHLKSPEEIRNPVEHISLFEGQVQEVAEEEESLKTEEPGTASEFTEVPETRAPGTHELSEEDQKMTSEEPPQVYYIPDDFLDQVVCLTENVKPHLNNNSEGHQSLDETTEIHQSPEAIEYQEELGSIVEIQNYEETENVEKVESPETNQPLEFSKSPEEIQNTVDIESLDENKKKELKSPMEIQKSEDCKEENLEVNLKTEDCDSAPESTETPETRASERVGLSEEEQEMTLEETGLKTLSFPGEIQFLDDVLCMSDQSLTDDESGQSHEEQFDNSSETQSQEHENPEDVETQTAEYVIEKGQPEKLTTTAAPHTLGTVESLVIRALVRKLLKELPTNMRSHHDAVVEVLEKAALDQFTVPDGVYLKPKNIKKLGKAGARDLIYKYGSASKLLLMAVGPESTEFQKNAMKHLNIHLDAFRSQPRTGLARFF